MIKQMIPLFLVAAMCSGFVPVNFYKQQPVQDSTKKAKQKPPKPVSKPTKSNTSEPADIFMLPLWNHPGIK